MGSCASKRKLERLEIKDAMNQLLYTEQQSRAELLHQEELAKLRSNIDELREEVRNKEKLLILKSNELANEQQKNISLMFSEVPFHLLADKSDSSCIDLSKTYEMVTLAQCDIVGFAELSSYLKPHEAVSLIDHIQAIIDESFNDNEIFVMERFADGCIAASGLVTHQIKPDSISHYHTVTSFDISENHHSTPNISPKVSQASITATKNYSYYASLIALGALKLLSLSTTIKIPQLSNHQLQLRVGLHSGSCSAGVITLQTIVGAVHVPHYKLFGPTINLTKRLCSTSLALQIKVSQACWDLLTTFGGFKFERCPDFMTCGSNLEQIESYWLIGHEGYNFPLPSIDSAVSLSNYEDI